MRNTEQRNEDCEHNASVTPRPAILIPATKDDHDGFAVLMSKEGPQLTPADLEGKKFFAEWGIEQLQPVKEFSHTFLESEEDRKRLKGLVLLRSAHEESLKNRAAAQNALAQAAELLIDDELLLHEFARGNVHEVPAMFYPAFFSREMKTARIVMWRTRSEQFLPAIFCPDLRTASFIAAAFRGLSVCRNCQKLFDPYAERIDGSRGDDKYCTVACGQRLRQKLYRQRVASKKRARRKRRRRHGK